MSTEGQHSTVSKCPTCGTTAIAFDPPLYFEASEMCGQIKPGTYLANSRPVPQCNLAVGHDGGHTALIEYEESWVDDASAPSLVDALKALWDSLTPEERQALLAEVDSLYDADIATAEARGRRWAVEALRRLDEGMLADYLEGLIVTEEDR